ncbi:MAG: replicative DNA helicase [Gammaproteobacteria bacterium]|nr:replicative DNA helicase [Gammaproteobacteria bacterium]MBI5617670.1 replicative DNA helicase [Gammaproteobacteria bacterium]
MAAENPFRSPSPDRATEGLRVPPHSVEAEQSVLGGLMLDNEAWLQISEKLTDQDFYRRDHASIFRGVEALANAGKPYDIVTLAEWLEMNGQLAAAGGLQYLAQLADNTPTAANIGAYADIVRERAVLRSLIRAGTDIAESAFRTEGRSALELLDDAERVVFQIAERESRGRKGFQPIKQLLVAALDRIDQLHQRDSPITGVPTGYAELDDMTSGLQPSDLVIVAGRPSMGKTAFALNLAQNAALHADTPVAIFSMEMPSEQLAMRLLSSLGRIDQHKLRTGKLGDDDWPRLTHAVGHLSEVKLYIDDTPALTPGDLRARCRRLAREHGLGMVVIDYLQLMHVHGTSENRATEISEISRSLKALAKELNVPVIALSQLNRSLEQRGDKRPVMSDLRESGAIEQDADVIMFIYRDEVYNEDSTDKGIAEIIIGKQRNGPIGVRKLRFFGEYTRFENLAHDSYGSLEGRA